jgi:predicted molibdopterin-dependent oxidoreductase YjgC
MIKAEREVRTVCPYCGVGCSLFLHIKDERIVRVSGDFEGAANHGNLCVKGRFGTDFVHAPDRLREPWVRREGKLQPAGWEEAIDEVVHRLAAIQRAHGPDSIAFLTSAKCTNEENYLLQKIARGVVGTSHVDHCARL